MILPNISGNFSGAYGGDVQPAENKIIEFKGLNQQPVINNGEFAKMTNLSARNYPCLSPRLQRSVFMSDVSDITALIAFGADAESFAWVQGNHLYYKQEDRGALSEAQAGSERQLVVFQDRILIWPDKMYYDVTDNELGSLESSVSSAGLVFSASVLDEALNNAVKYASIKASSAFTEFNTGDGLKVSGCAVTAANNINNVIDHISEDKKTLYFFENTFSDGTETGSVTLSRTAPDMDYICVANNRVWGCKGNTIYGSKQGSAENWNNSSSVSTDSYFVDVSSPGDFTGCHAYGNYVVFLKENYIHKIIGTKPKNYQTSDIVCPSLGLEKNSHKSICYVSGYLYFKSQHGIVAFNGGTPWLVSDKLVGKYANAVAGTDGRYYYVSMTDAFAYSFFVYDTFSDLWHREDDLRAVVFCFASGALYVLSSVGKIISIGDSSDGELVRWSGTLGEFTEFSAEEKIAVRFRMRIELAHDSSLTVEYQADGGAWVTAWTYEGYRRDGFYISIVPTRCDSLVIRLSGTGDCKIYQIDRIFDYSTDMR